MNLSPNELQLGLAEAARALLEREAPVSALVRGDDSGAGALHARIWEQAAEQGWLALGLAEEAGGLGLGLPEELIVFRELGRFVTPGPFLASVLGARVAADAGDTSLAERIAGGQLRVGMLADEVVLDVSDGVGDGVGDGDVAGGLALRIDELGAELIELSGVAPVPSTDPHSPTATAAGRRVVLQHEDPALIARARVLAAAELLGIIEAVRDMSTAYAQVREQFGRPIGSFQAVKHRCADMAIAATATVGQVFQAALYVESGHPDAAMHAAAAYVLAARGAYRSAADNIQNHGGIGFTWEHPAHLYLKRTIVLENLFGPLRASLVPVLEPARHEFR
jgi:alkylation response protein AidB-like acyl-CoA dehydrogenase